MPRTKQQKKQEEEHVPSIFESLGLSEDGKTKQSKGADSRTRTVSDEDLLAKIDALTSTVDRLQSENKTLMALGTASPPPQTYTPPAAPRLSLEGLPNQMDDPEEYQKQLAARVEQHAQAVSDYNQQIAEARASQNADAQNKINAMWEAFGKAYPDYAERPNAVKFAATEVMAAAEAKGYDRRKYITVAQDQFFKDIVTFMKDDMGVSVGEGEETPDMQQHNQPGARELNNRADEEEDEGDESRTGGIFGGMESSFKPSSGGSKGKEAGDLVTDLTDLQKSSGYF